MAPGRAAGVTIHQSIIIQSINQHLTLPAWCISNDRRDFLLCCWSQLTWIRSADGNKMRIYIEVETLYVSLSALQVPWNGSKIRKMGCYNSQRIHQRQKYKEIVLPDHRQLHLHFSEYQQSTIWSLIQDHITSAKKSTFPTIFFSIFLFHVKIKLFLRSQANIQHAFLHHVLHSHYLRHPRSPNLFHPRYWLLHQRRVIQLSRQRWWDYFRAHHSLHQLGH